MSRTEDEKEPIMYIEPLASSREWLHDVIPSGQQVGEYLKSLFPISTWIYRYNWTWFLGDLVAGATVGVVVIPQGMAYSKLAQLPPEFGLYSSFIGCALYFMFATSKDITIGPVAVMSTLMGNILTDVLPLLPQYADKPWLIAGCMSVVMGCIVMAIGLLRLGFIVEFIPLPAIAAFMTGSALSIAMGQIPTLMGNNSFKAYNTRAPTYLVFGNFFKYIKHCNINAAVGLTALFLLYAIRWTCNYCARRWPKREKMFFFLNTLRTAFVILLYTLISYLVNRNHRDSPKFSILGVVPRGFQHMQVPVVTSEILSKVAGKLPSAIIVLVIEHISISKSFGRINNYTINPNQELIAIGITNIFGPFFGGYPATGSFSRTAIKSKSGVRTPLAGVITAAIVVIAIYALPPVFFYISNALLAAVIIHAVGDLISTPTAIKKFWKVSPIEFVIFCAGVIVSIFSTIDNGIYTSVALSGALLLFRIAKAQGKFVGSVRIYDRPSLTSAADGSRPPSSSQKQLVETGNSRNAFVPLDCSDGINPAVKPQQPTNGIFIYRFNEGYLYPNAMHFTEHMVAGIVKRTRAGIANPYGSLGNRPWNDPGPRHKTDFDIDTSLPVLRAVILDFTGVSNVDITSIQNLVDVRRQLDRYANGTVSWHFAGIKSLWTRRALIAGGFGSSDSATRTVFSVANIGMSQDKEYGHEHETILPSSLVSGDEEFMADSASQEKQKHELTANSFDTLAIPVLGINHPFFHVDLDEALNAAEVELGFK
ncbi:hypothetical protein LPJ66_007736 [Kickxella alabastrina]|uniref:Uncharacterized protein n=1 Tax=Kickxella alabastrina TaxID=61397 RepID=A0ACC1I8L0_9FUNG|nr:hypothetical protein LPJ66_007736 [Kickxella alabastrina]